MLCFLLPGRGIIDKQGEFRMHVEQSKQRGVTLMGFCLGISLVIITITLLVSLVPPYMTQHGVVASVKSVRDQYESHTPDQILMALRQGVLRDKIAANLSMNHIDTVDTKAIILKPKNGKGVSAIIKYDVTRHVVGNIDALIHFNKTIAIAGTHAES